MFCPGRIDAFRFLTEHHMESADRATGNNRQTTINPHNPEN